MSKRGLGSMPEEKRKAIQSMGGKRSWELGKAYRWTSETAKLASAKRKKK